MEIKVIPVSVAESKYQALRRENAGLLKSNNELRAADWPFVSDLGVFKRVPADVAWRMVARFSDIISR